MTAKNAYAAARAERDERDNLEEVAEARIEARRVALAEHQATTAYGRRQAAEEARRRAEYAERRAAEEQEAAARETAARLARLPSAHSAVRYPLVITPEILALREELRAQREAVVLAERASRGTGGRLLTRRAVQAYLADA